MKNMNYCKVRFTFTMEITTKGTTTTKTSFSKSNDYYSFHYSPTTTALLLFKELSIHYLCNDHHGAEI